MSIKKNVLNQLELNRGEFISGEELATSLLVSRTAVWKAIKQLEQEGYSILAVPNKGYCLSCKSDVISEEGIRVNLLEQYNNIPIQVEKTTTSTNHIAKLAAANGAVNGSVFIAEKQTMGRGRLGRTFLSLEGTGIYMSIVLKPKVNAENAILITTAASVAVFRSIKEITKKKTSIKWVNDLYYENRKICGILTEAVTDVETGVIESIILGIGINFSVRKEMIPEDLKDVAGALYHGETEGITRNQLIAEIINQVFKLCMRTEDRSFIAEYKENSMLLGSDIYILAGEEKTKAKAIDINESGGLVVELEDGTVRILNSGEVSIRKC